VTQPNLPAAAAQKQAAVEVFAQYEPPLYEAYLDMMLEWLAAVKTTMFAGGVVSLGLIPDPLTVFSQTPKWDALTAQYTEQVARDVLAAPYKNLFADSTLFESRPFVRNWIATTANRLSAVPNEVYGAVAQIIDSATTNGASIPDVTEQIDQLFGDAAVSKWKNRARTVARTEVVGAYNGGLHDAFSMVVTADDTGTAWMHRWLATEDARTRPDHVEADGQLQPFGQPFIVGGFQMMHPHDPTAPPKETVNCRCVELLEIEGDPTDMGNRQYLGDHNQAPRPVTASVNLMQTVCTDGRFCLETHKPGLCAGQKRGESEPGQQDATKQTPAVKAQIAVKGLSTAISQAQAVAVQNAASNPKLAAMARKAVADYSKALRGHQQTLKQAGAANAKAAKTGAQDAKQQDSMDKAAARAEQRAEAKKDALNQRAQAILDRRAEAAKVAKMSPKERAAYGKQKSAQAKAKRAAAEAKTLKEAATA
jgi:hypothetical protein